jgi:hypothetical protein
MIKVDSGVLINHAEILKETTAKYPLIRTEVKMNTCSTGSGSFMAKRMFEQSTNQGIFCIHFTNSSKWQLYEKYI